jgi:hypothetical protein
MENQDDYWGQFADMEREKTVEYIGS